MAFSKFKRALVFLFLTFVLSGCTVPGDPNTPRQLADLITVIKNVVGLLVPAAGIAFFFMLLLGGVQFLLSGGDPKSVAHARNTMTYAIIGVILVVVSWLVLLVLKSTLGIDLTTVQFPISGT